MDIPTRLDRGDGIALAVKHRAGAEPTLMFLPGYGSDMDGSKATALDAFAGGRGVAMLRFDYSGCGASDGAFADGTLARWRDDALAVLDTTTGPVVLVGSSMGGWLMLLVALARPDRVRALVGIAAAPDFTDWGFTPDQKAALQREVELGRSDDPDAPPGITLGFWQSGEALRLLHDAIAIDCPVRLLHGDADREVPPEVSLRLADRVRSADVQTILVKGGDHRLSRPQDLALLETTVAALLEA